jgi:hypothetical protein
MWGYGDIIMWDGGNRDEMKLEVHKVCGFMDMKIGKERRISCIRVVRVLNI